MLSLSSQVHRTACRTQTYVDSLQREQTFCSQLENRPPTSCSSDVCHKSEGRTRQLGRLGESAPYQSTCWTILIIIGRVWLESNYLTPWSLAPSAAAARWFPKNQRAWRAISELNGNKLTCGSALLIVSQWWKHVLPQVFHERQLHIN